MPRLQIASGTNTIDSVTPVRLANGKYRIQWKIRLQDGRLLSRDTTGSTKGEARARAHAKAAELLAQGGIGGTWKPSSLATEYLETVSKPIITESSRLSPNSKARYKTVLTYLTEAFKGYSIASVARRRTIEELLKGIAAEHGAESGRHAKGVASRYFFEELIKDDVIEFNPLAGARIDLGTVKKTTRPEGGRALTTAEYDRVLTHLLTLNPAEGVVPPKRGRYTLADRVAVHRCCIDLTLLQMATSSSTIKSVQRALFGLKTPRPAPPASRLSSSLRSMNTSPVDEMKSGEPMLWAHRSTRTPSGTDTTLRRLSRRSIRIWLATAECLCWRPTAPTSGEPPSTPCTART